MTLVDDRLISILYLSQLSTDDTKREEHGVSISKEASRVSLDLSNSETGTSVRASRVVETCGERSDEAAD